MDYDTIVKLFRALHDQKAEYIVVGAVAINLHGLVRGTDDLDLFVRPTEANVERVRLALKAVWDDPEIDKITAEDLAGEYPTIRYGPPGGGDETIDLLARLGTAFVYDDLEWQTMTVEGTPVRVATPATLLRMKKDTTRAEDAIDAQRLRERFGLEDV